MPRYLLFDIDGTLVDSVDLHAQAWQVTFRKFGKDVPFQAVRDQIGKGGDQLLPVFWEPEQLAAIGEEMKDYRSKLFRENYLSQVVPFPDVRKLLQKCQADGKTVVLASSANKKDLTRLTQIAHIEDLLDAETCSDDAEKSKPHPDIFQAALESVGAKPDEAIAIGDTPYDAIAAAKAGIRTVGVLCGGWSEADLKEAGCIAIYADPADLLQNYENSPLAG